MSGDPGSGARRLSGWGRTAPTTAYVRAVRDPADVVAAVQGVDGRGILARGLGRSYGDAAQNAGGLVLDMTTLARVHHIDAATGLVDVDAGVSLGTLMRALLPSGLWVPVLPGTRQVSVGGAVAADVHGKNHHVVGSFGSHVRSLHIVTADGTVHSIGPEHPLFWATVGGMGLTGVIVRATIACHRVESAFVLVDTERAGDLEDLMVRLSADDAAYPYSVAWFDSIATGRRLGRAVITRGRNARLDELAPGLAARALDMTARRRATLPSVLPPGLVNRATGRAFNEMWFRAAPRLRRGEVQDAARFFHPLDVVGRWNHVYGPRGFCQYQFVVPLGAQDALRAAVGAIASSGHVSCLNVLKRFGPANAGLLSFPTPGWTLAVDLPVRPGLDRLFAVLDALVLEAGGRLYLAKDSRASADTVARMYPRLAEFRAERAKVDPAGVFVSDLARRLQLTDAPTPSRSPS
ncbi:MAG: FAD-binding oxidoreductase [Actinomycetota bacterium]|nr:FAD-binding oxidoreductase [Actinomycetota bacterium]